MTSLTKRPISGLVFVRLGTLVFVACSRGQRKYQQALIPTVEDSDGYQALSVVLNALSVQMKSETITIPTRTLSSHRVREIQAACSGIAEEFNSASEDFDRSCRRFRREADSRNRFGGGHLWKPMGLW